MTAMSSVNGKVVLITGGARGVGEEVARRLRRKGAKLVLTDVDVAPLDALAAELGGDDQVLTAVADVLDLPAMQRAVDAAVERFGGIDINVVGVFNTVRAALPSIIERRGYVLVVSSLAAVTSAPGLAAYHASKAGADTPLVQDAKSDLAAFRTMLRRMPGPLKQTTTVTKCGEAFVKGIEGRKSRIYCPEWVGLFRWIRPLVAMPLGERDIRKFTPELLPELDAEVAAPGRSTSARTEALEK